MNMQQQFKQLTQSTTVQRAIQFIPLMGLVALAALLPVVKRVIRPYILKAGHDARAWYQHKRSQDTPDGTKGA